MRYFIGLDAHSKTSTFAVVDEKGQCVLRKTVDTSEKNLSDVIDHVNGERHLTFEESTISQWLYVSLREKVDNLLVCNPVYVAKKHGAKTDFRDALHLAQELRGGHLQGVYHDSSHWIQLRVSVSGYQDIVQEIIRFKNRLKAVFRAEAISTDANNFYKDKILVERLQNDSSKFVAEKLFNQIQFLEEEKLQFRTLFNKNKKLYKPIRNLMTIPGINLIRANIICAIMLVRHIQESGGKTYGHKRFFGRRELRDVFIGATESALRSNSSLRDHYEAKRASGVSHKDAKVDLSRRIAALALSLLKNNNTYNDNYKEYLLERKRIRLKLNQIH